MVYDLLESKGQLVSGLCFAWGMRWRTSRWCRMMKQMGDGNYEVR